MGGGPFDDGAEFDTSTQQLSWTGTPTTNNALVIGQRVGVRFYITNIGTMAGGYTCTLYHGSYYTNSYIQLAENLSLASPSVSPSVSPSASPSVSPGSKCP